MKATFREYLIEFENGILKEHNLTPAALNVVRTAFLAGAIDVFQLIMDIHLTDMDADGCAETIVNYAKECLIIAEANVLIRESLMKKVWEES